MISNYKEIITIIKKNELKLDMKSEDEQQKYIRPEDDIDFHAYRILMLINQCGILKEGISDYPFLYGRTKFSFYDFLIRYPGYLIKLVELKRDRDKEELIEKIGLLPEEESFILSPMITYIRGPWDKRYDSIFNYMISKGLLEVGYRKITKSGSELFCIILTNLGYDIANQIVKIEIDWLNRMDVINLIFKKNTTNDNIEKMIFNDFRELIMG